MKKKFGTIRTLQNDLDFVKTSPVDHPVLQEISEVERKHKQNRINVNKGLSLFQMKDGSQIWALNEKSANKKFLKLNNNE